VVNELNNNGIAIETNNDTLIETNGGSGDFIYPLGSNDAIVQANTFLQSIIDLGKGTVLDVQNNPNGFDVIYGQQNDPGFQLVVTPSGFSGLLFLANLQMTTADLSPVNTSGTQNTDVEEQRRDGGQPERHRPRERDTHHGERQRRRVSDRKQSVHPRGDGLTVKGVSPRYRFTTAQPNHRKKN
jgi:hypothetical protein